MSLSKRPLDPNRIRHPPAQGFSWIDRRFVRQGWIERLPQPALLLYFFLVTVSDHEGLSFYGDLTVCRLLAFDPEELSQARARLLSDGLILYDHPFYQVLPLPPRGPPLPSPPNSQPPQRRPPGEPMTLGEILREAWRQAATRRSSPQPPRRGNSSIS